jgi:cyclophilin family peptidyl-prolyl cis-trans isomerase
MRCIKNFLCQFGIAGIPSYNKPYNGKGNLLIDDRNWLPEGPTHRKNALGVKRFSKGYLAYAGGGKNSRSNQFIVALHDNERLGGGSPWEVPWGELVGKESYDTLDKIYTGYGENGPSQARLSREGSSEGVRQEFPNLDYILGCNVIDSR